MNITSLTFLIFVLAALCVYYLQPFTILKKVSLLVINFCFLLSFSNSNAGYLIMLVLYTYVAAVILENKKHWLILLLPVSAAVAGLCIYKYSGYFSFLLQRLGYEKISRLSLVMPLGISFFTFKAIWYLVDVYRGKCAAERSFLNYAVYLSFFPQMLSGPIQPARDFLPQLQQKIKIHIPLIRHGFLLLFFGFFEKIVISERLYQIVEQSFSDYSELSPSLALIGCIAYSFYLYSDFDGYSNIAIGLAEMFGFQCEKNFNTPYFSKSIKEFWTRWHISLSTWLKEVVYFSAGGSRINKFRTYFNIILVFFVSGMWHGSTWNYLLWGLMNALLQITQDLLDVCLFRRIKVSNLVIQFVLSAFKISITFSLVTCLWVFFRCSNIEEIKTIFVALFQFDINMFVFAVPEIAAVDLYCSLFLLILFIVVDLLRYSGFGIAEFSKLMFPVRWVVYLCVLAMMIIFGVYGPGYDPSQFVYIQF